jgi:hypothetical protein
MFVENSTINIIKITSTCLVILSLTGCGIDTNPVDETPVDENQEQPEITETFETTKLELQVNLPANSEIHDTQAFSIDNPSTYNASVSGSVCDPLAEQVTLTLYFINTTAKKWDIYLKLGDDLLDVEGGEIGGTGQVKATLEFDEDGVLLRQIPYIINSTEIQTPEKNYNIEFDFYTHSTTNIEESFNPKKFGANGC